MASRFVFQQQPDKRFRAPGRLKGIIVKSLIGLVLASVITAGALLTAGIVVYKSYAKELVPAELLTINEPSAGARILDRNGKLLYEYVDNKAGVRTPVTLTDVNPAFLAATIATEDSTFYTNPGVNPKGLVRAAWENFNPFEDQGILQGTGGSSITQQLVKNVYIPESERDERSISRKVRELVYAAELTKQYEKSQILEWYVNQISYGGIYSGVEAASQGYFGKSARDLTLAEAALLAGIPQSPAAYDPVNNLEAAMQRRNEVLDLMAKHEQIQIGSGMYFEPNAEDIAAAKLAPIEVRTPYTPIEAPHFVLSYIAPQLEALFGRDALLHDGLVVTTTLDLDLQQRAQGILNGAIAQFEVISNTHNGAALVLDPKSGEVLAMIGSRDYFRDDIDGNVNNLLALNSPGSTLKPFVYLTGFMLKGWRPETIVQDTPITYRESDGSTFSPVNPNKDFKGRITIRNALGNSLNVPAFKAALEIGVPNVVSMGKSVGLTSLDGYYGPAIAIGGVDVKPLDLTYAYSVLANGGVMRGTNAFAPEEADERSINPAAILTVQNAAGETLFDLNQHRAEVRVAPADQVWRVTDILSDPQATCLTFGCGGLSVPGVRTAVKTGTSEPFDPKGPNAGKIGETWAFGYTPDLVVGVWAGNSDNAPIVNIYSTSISYRAMRDILLSAYEGRERTPFVPVGAPAQPPAGSNRGTSQQTPPR